MQTVWLPSLSNLFLGLLICVTLCSCNDDPPCFQVTSSFCSEYLKNGNKCSTVPDQASLLYCCNITTERELQEHIGKFKTSSQAIRGFHLRDSTLYRLPTTVFNDLRELSSLSITENTITKFEGNFEHRIHGALTCFNISRNKQLGEISPQIISNLPSLRNFDMSNNQLSLVPDLPRSISTFFKLDVSENKFLHCKYLLNLTLMMDEKKAALTFANTNTTICLPPNGKGSLYDGLVHMKMENLEDVKGIFRDCPVIKENVKCECSIYSLDYADGSNKNTPYMYQALVNCSNKQMTSLPKVLPPNTRVLDISNNSITSFEGIGNETYSNVKELYADNNKIASLKHLEGTYFFDNFHTLTLRNNKVDQIQEYLLSNVFDRNLGKTLLLGKNELKCDCYAASHTKVWLIANKAHIPDYDQIFATCERPTKILELDSKDLCAKPTSWKDYIRYLIVVEVLLFILLIGKVSYDYYVFKSAGYLPWPASKMPKLPCDWCFET